MASRLVALALLGLLTATACGNAPEEPPRPSPTPSASPSPSPLPTPQSVRFFTFGDWGTGGQPQKDVAAAVEKFCPHRGCDFGLLLGDNFYDVGVASVSDPQWQEKFEAVYTLDVPFYALLGNHDYDGNEQAQIDYSALSERWRMPARNYQIRRGGNEASPLLEIFVIDSNAVDATTSAELQAAIEASEALWKIAALHHPPYSNGPHPDDELGQNAFLLPLICSGIDAVLAGHNHFFAHLDDPNDGCSFQEFIVGTGGRALHSIQNDSRTIYAEAEHGFAWIEASADSLLLEFQRRDLVRGYSYRLEK
ncbi:MAG TPA: metallophosphoesterase [bacterium]|nr:metallophosphoesterase [bacterium]